MKSAWLFPGQGSQSVGMGLDVSRRWPVARRTFEEADEALGFSLSALCFEGPEEELRRTAVTQPAILTTSMACARVLTEEAGHRPDGVAGHSLGEYSALVCAGVMDFADAVRAVHRRGRFMQEAVPEGEGAMAALMGLEDAVVDEICREAAGDEVVAPANLNAPGQVVIAGHAGAVRRAGDAARERGAKRVVELNVSAPFHCALMAPAADRMAPVLADIPFKGARMPVWSNVTAAPEEDGDRLRAALVAQITAAVRWQETQTDLVQRGFEQFVEVGPGTVLAGLMRRTCRGTRVAAAGTAEALDALVGGST